MLSENELRHIANVINEHDRLCRAHRGVLVGPGQTLIVFGNDGHIDEPVGMAAVSHAKAALKADGFVVGETVTSDDRYVWLFETNRMGGRLTGEIAAAEMAVWEGWAAARDLTLERDTFAAVQRGIARAACEEELFMLDGG
jgi:hypothetical protein